MRDAQSPYARIEQFVQDDGHKLGPEEIYECLGRLMYNRRSKMNPLWNSLIVGGYKDGQRCLVPALPHPSRRLSC